MPRFGADCKGEIPEALQPQKSNGFYIQIHFVDLNNFQEEMILLERILLQTIRFDLHVEHPVRSHGLF
jgi:hypothetical protein